MVLVGTASCRHNAQLARSGAIEPLLLVLQVLHKLYTVSNTIRLEAEEIKATAGLG
jgi:aspartyl/asparaginyl-tRNA synthetase